MNENTLQNQLPNSLPEGLTLEYLGVPQMGASGPDLQGVLKTPNGEFQVAIEVKNTGGTATFREAARQVKRYASQAGAVPFVAGPFFGEAARQVAKEEGVGIMDLAGNFYLKKDDIYIEKIVDKNPFAQKVSLKNLFAPISSRITRILLAQPEKTWLLEELSQEATVSLGQTHKTIDRMIEEEMVERNQDNRLALKNPNRLLETWKQTYPLYQSKKLTFFSFEQNTTKLLSSVLERTEDLPFALSFFSGADLVAPFIRGVTKLQLYVKQSSDIERWEKLFDLQEVVNGANVELYIPYDEGVFYQTQKIPTSFGKKVPVVSNIQLYMDLFNNPARGVEQAEHLRELKLSF
ncbi:MAG: type IV toxin-antitoxin system AbiEi family antitoxin [Candidatus Roizmanbacteria bacterium]|nr:type IV toxin-antitoxin system AbiEi family antitoxin [Candidatus Roizmanbacteria bacterium]